MNSNLHRLVRWPLVLACLLSACAPAASAQRVPEEATATAAPTDTEAPTATSAPTVTATPLPPTATATRTPVPPTQTPLPTATRTPTPGPGDVLYSPSRTSDWDDWNVFYFGGERFTLTPDEGNLTMQIDGADTWVYAVYERDLPYADVQIDVDVEIVKGPNRNNLSLICRESHAGWYEFNILSGGLWDINKYVEGEGYTPLKSGGSTAIKMNQDVNHLTAVCAGDTLTFYVNDVKLASVRDRQFKTGRFGFSGSTFDIGHLKLFFQNFVVRVADSQAR